MAAIEDIVSARKSLTDKPVQSELKPQMRVPSVDRVLEVVAVFTVITGLIGLAATLADAFHAPQILLGGLLLTGWYTVRTRGSRSFPGASPRWMHIGVLIAVALFFRLPAYHYIMGGQDEGLYTNIAHYIEYSGGIVAHDHVKQQLMHTPFLERYIQDNHVSADGYLAGIYQRHSVNGKVEFQFYDMFPVWMALFGGLFGASLGIYALTFLSILSIVIFYRLALLLTASHRAALAAGALLALSPLHAFFSKFPVTEVPALAFSLIGFMGLAAYWSADPVDRRSAWLKLSVLAFLSLFTTRISGFMYVPFFVAMAMATLIFDRDPQRRKSIQYWTVGLVAAYLVSVVYGFSFSHSYSHDIYLHSFEPLFGSHWKIISQLLVIAGLLLWCIAGVASNVGWCGSERMRRVARFTQMAPAITVFASLICGFWFIYRLGWTDHYAGTSLDTYWHLVHHGWHSASAASLWTLVAYLGPLLVLASLLLIGKEWQDPRLTFLSWFVAGFFAYAALLQWVTFYSPYYARYMLSELVPYLILFVACAWATMRTGKMRAALSLALVLSLVYGCVTSAEQIGKNENDGVYSALSRLTAPIESGDLLLLGDLNGVDVSEIKTPLIYTFHHNVVSVDASALRDAAYIGKLNSLYDDLFLISARPVTPRGFTKIDSVRFWATAFKRTHFVPRKLVRTQDVVLNLYRLDRPLLPLNSAKRFGPADPWVAWLSDGWSDPEPWGVWSSGQQAMLRVDPQQLPTIDGLVLQFDAKAFVTSTHPRQRIEVSVDDTHIAEYRATYPNFKLSLDIPISKTLLEGSRPITIKFGLPDAVSPRSVGASGDVRTLALGLVGVTATTQRQAIPVEPN